MDPDPLQWLWDGVNKFQIKFNDLRTRASRNFKRPFDVAQHDVHCGLNNSQTQIPCSCCKGALTFDEARLVKEKLTAGRAVPNQKNEILGLFLQEHAGVLKIARSFFFLSMTRKHYLQRLKQAPVTTSRICSLAAAESYRGTLLAR